MAYAVAVSGGVAIVIRTFLKGLKEGERDPTGGRGTVSPAPSPLPSPSLEVVRETATILGRMDKTLDRIAEYQFDIRERGERDASQFDEAVRSLERSERILSRMEEFAENSERARRADAMSNDTIGKTLGQIRDLLLSQGDR